MDFLHTRRCATGDGIQRPAGQSTGTRTAAATFATRDADTDALKRLATVLVDKSGPDYCAYRVGGDEFIIIGKEIHEEEIKLFIDELRGGLKKEKLSASFGYAVLNSGDSFDEICNKADEQMYEDKRRYKARPAVD